MERDKTALERQLDASKKQLDAETSKRTQLEKKASAQKSELIALKDHKVKLERDLNKALKDLKDREWQIKQLESKQDKTIVEHVHVLEEAKRVTDGLLKQAQEELRKQDAYIRSLENAKKLLAGEAEDLARETERERLELNAQTKAARGQEERAIRALADAENEKRAREALEIQVRRLQADLLSGQSQTNEVRQQLLIVQRSKDNLETELARLADEVDSPNAMAKVQRDYEQRIAQLEAQLEDSESSRNMAVRIKEHVDRQHAEIRRLLQSSGPKDDTFRSRLLRELQLADEEMEREMADRSAQLQGNKAVTFSPTTPTKNNGVLRLRKDSKADLPRTPERQLNADRQTAALRQQVQVLELQMAASDRVRQHLETALREVTSDLEKSDGSKAHLQRCQARLSKEKARLAELLEEEALARHTAQANHSEGVQAIWNKFKATMEEERQSYARLEESRKALVSAYFNTN
jgi:myosin heavy chain 9/10/11/14